MTNPAGSAADQAAPAPEGVLNRSYGRWYPTDFVVALVDDVATAEAAVVALVAAGFPKEDLIFWTGEQVLAYAGEARRQEGPFHRLVGRIQEHTATEGEVARRYRAAAEQGQLVVAVRAETADRVEAARRALAELGAHDMQHFDRWTVTDLSVSRRQPSVQ